MSLRPQKVARWGKNGAEQAALYPNRSVTFVPFLFSPDMINSNLGRDERNFVKWITRYEFRNKCFRFSNHVATEKCTLDAELVIDHGRPHILIRNISLGIIIINY